MSAFEEEEYQKKLDFTLWRKLIKYAAAYKKYFFILMGFMVCAGAVDVVFPLMTKYAIDNFILAKDLKGLPIFSVIYAVLVFAQVLNIWMFISIAGKIEMGMSYDIKKIGFTHLQELSLSYYDKTPVGWIMARMTSDAARLSEIIAWSLVDLLWGFTMMLGIMIVMFVLNWKLALITLCVVPFLALISVYFQQKLLKSYREVRKTNSKITGSFNEGIMGAKTTKTLVREEQNSKEFHSLTRQMYQSSITAAIISSIYMPIVMGLGSIGAGMALWIGGGDVLLKVISYGTLVAFLSYAVQFFEPVRQIAQIFAEFQSAQASAERVISLLETKPDINDTQEVTDTYGDAFNPIGENWQSVNGEITFKDVSFSYKDGEKVLDHFNLKVKSGETVALVGETGSGKSTIVNLACRFYQPTEGEILIDGVDYKKRSQLWLQSNLGYVLQAPHLFSGTIRENIRYGRLEATDEEVEDAAQLVSAHEFINKLDKGYDTEVGEGGNRLSTGEKQLISFARAVLANPRIFVLDEATSSIDTETEQIIQNAIHRVLRGRTSFIIAHRLSTIRSADRILVVRQGKIEEEGNHHQLLTRKGYYYRLYTNQFKEEQEAKLMNA